MGLLVGQLVTLFVRADRNRLWMVGQTLLERVVMIVVVELFARMEKQSGRMVDQNHLFVEPGPISVQTAMQ